MTWKERRAHRLSLAAGLAWLALALAAGPARRAGCDRGAATAAQAQRRCRGGHRSLRRRRRSRAAFAVSAWSVPPPYVCGPSAGWRWPPASVPGRSPVRRVGAGRNGTGFGWLALSTPRPRARGGASGLRPGVEDGRPIQASPPARPRPGVLGLVAYGVGAQRAGGLCAGHPVMSHRLAVLLAIGPVAHEGGTGRAARLAAGLLCVALLLAQAPLAAWLHPEGVAIYP